MDIKKISESLSPNEIKIIPHLSDSVDNICEKTGLERVSVLRALEFLEKKGAVKISHDTKKVASVGVNGAFYLKKCLPERRLLNALSKKRVLSFDEVKSEASLSDEEFKAAIGVLKRKNLIELKNSKISLNGHNGEIAKKTEEEIFLESLPVEYESLSKEQKNVFDSLNKRKDIVELKDEKIVKFEVTEIGRELSKANIKNDMIEQITPEILKKDSAWKGKKFRRYDVSAKSPEIHGGKRHFVNQASDYARRIWTDMGFKEMNGNIVESSFWVFDALFTAQDHPVREMQDTFFISKKTELPDKKIVKAVKDAHEKGVDGSRGWKYSWDEDDAKKLVVRTHTTGLSVQTLAKLDVKNLPQKFFALGKCFRNETLDWKHGFEFNQTEGIVVDRNANFRNLLGYLKQFFSKMGFEKIRIRPAYFPYTEPSVEIDAWHPEKKEWLELGGAGMFRPEVIVPMLGEYIPVLAWGPGFDRILMDYYGIKDIRDLYKNDIKQLREMKAWMKT